ncbi:MAG TPA: DUF4097 family beta strand repeat-containing protein [Acidimicrobiia bacterium]|jgi:DUF4097 and DUF4098 domain-containing protein YvlB
MSKPTSVTPTGDTVRVTTHSGSVTVIGEDRPDILVEDDVDRIAAGADEVEIKSNSGSITVRCPVDTHVFAGTSSGSVSLQGHLGRVHVTSASGNITIAHVQSADARTNSGSIDVADCDGECRCRTPSGSIRIGRAGSVDLVAASGSVEGTAVGAATVHVGSGSVDLGIIELDRIEVDAHSGSVSITLPAGSHPATDLHAGSGAVRCDCTPGDNGAVRVTTGSGSITVTER